MQIAWIGAGKMTQSFLKGFKEAKVAHEHHVSSRTAASSLALQKDFDIEVHFNNVSCIKNAQLIVLAVKPSQLHDVCVEIKDFIPPDAFVISLAVGIDLNLLESWLGSTHKLIRMMPTTAVSIQKGSIALCCNDCIKTCDLQTLRSVFEPLAILHPVSEDDMNVFVANSGSGIAFVYRLMKAFMDASIKNGMDEFTSQELVAQTFDAAAAMAKNNAIDLEKLIQDVSSKNGTTVAGLAILDQSIDRIVLDTFDATQKRADEIQKELKDLYERKS